MTMYLSDYQINQMALAAVKSYEMTADWKEARRAAHEFAIDDIGVRPNHTAVLLAVKLAKAKWAATMQRVKQQASA
jgi:hypothetical protein